MLYVIRRNDGMFVAPPGRTHSYTKKLQEARVFLTRAEAERERCPGNENVFSVEELMGR